MRSATQVREEIQRTALAYFSSHRAESVPLVCPACGMSFPVPVSVLRASPSVACPGCLHERPSPALPGAIRGRDRSATLSEFPAGPQ